MSPRERFERIISLYITCLLMALVKSAFVKKDSYPKIADIITFSDEKIDHIVPPNTFVKNFSFNIEKLDMRKFKRNQGAFMKQILGYDMIDQNISRTLNESRRNIPYFYNNRDYRTAQQRQTFTKIADIMLQTIYMARHKIKLLERKAGFKKETIAYRVAFLYEKLRVTAKKIYTIYTTMMKKRHYIPKYQNEYFYFYHKWGYMHPMLYLHHKAAKVHVDFLYMFWVYIKMYDIYAAKAKIPNTTPKEYNQPAVDRTAPAKSG